MIPFDMLGMASCYCAIVTLSLRYIVFLDIRLQNAVTLKTELWVRRGHWKCHRSTLQHYLGYVNNFDDNDDDDQEEQEEQEQEQEQEQEEMTMMMMMMVVMVMMLIMAYSDVRC